MERYPEAEKSGHQQLSKQLCSESCPFHNALTGQCKVNQMATTTARQKFCCSDDYDGCPTYLGYLLRRTNSFRVDHDWLDTNT